MSVPDTLNTECKGFDPIGRSPYQRLHSCLQIIESCVLVVSVLAAFLARRLADSFCLSWMLFLD